MELAREIQRRLVRTGVVANAIGILVTFFAVGMLLPLSVSEQETWPLTWRNALGVSLYTALVLPLAVIALRRRAQPILDWARSTEPASDRIRKLILNQPNYSAIVTAMGWDGAALLFGAVNLTHSVGFGITVGLVAALGGMITTSLAYLLTERIMRPMVARAMGGEPEHEPLGPGVTTRLTMVAGLTGGTPLLGVIAVGVAALSGADLSQAELAGAALFLSGVAIVVGAIGVMFAARSVAEPLAAVRGGLRGVEKGDYESRVEVDDAGEVGLLQAGFNRMAAGLEERERVRDLFGRQVGHEVAQSALEGDVELGGEVREVAALFVDVVGSTTLAGRRPPEEVVELLNRFFGIVVRTVEGHQGWVNKFEGDAALCVFGAPAPSDDCSAQALAAARELRDRLAGELPEIDAGIGVSAGAAVAGNVGAEERYEYTVIGDPVNEAARLCELAKSRPERVLASERALKQAGAGEAERWSLGELITLRGRDEPTRLATAA